MGRVRRRVIRMHPAPRSTQRQLGFLEGSHCFIIAGGVDLAEPLASALRGKKLTVEIVQAAVDLPIHATCVIHLGALASFSSVVEATDVLTDAMIAATRIASSMENHGQAFILVQDTGGQFGIDEWCEPNKAVLGGLAGLAKSAAAEWGGNVRSIDLDAGHRDLSKLASELANELLFGTEVEIGLPEGERVTVGLVDVESNSSKRVLGPDSVFVVSGGGRGVTARCVVELAKETKASFVLLGRTKISCEPDVCRNAETDAEIQKSLIQAANASGEKLDPKSIRSRLRSIIANREIASTIAAIETAGGRAVYYSVNVCEFSEVFDAVDSGRKKFGAITGLIHGAGVLRDKRLTEKTLEQFNLVFETKVGGFFVLCAATAQDDLDTICLFSSVAGRFGNAAQSDYAMANEVLNKMAQLESRRREDCQVKSLNWGPWDGGMVTPQLKEMFAERGVPVIGIDEGAAAFVTEILEAVVGADVEIVLGDSLVTTPADLVPTDGERVSSVEATETVILSSSERSLLADHVVDGKSVLPMVFPIEWCRALGSKMLSSVDVIVDEFTVVDGVRFEGVEDYAFPFEIRATSDVGLRLEIWWNGSKRYTSRVRVSDSGKSLGTLEQMSDFGKSGQEVMDVYDGDLLFHGPRFQILEGVQSNSSTAWFATLSDSVESTAAGALVRLDAGLQMSVLWTGVQTHGRTLPLSVGQLRFDGDLNDVTTVRIDVERSDKNHSRMTIAYGDKDGNIIAQMLDVATFKYRAFES